MSWWTETQAKIEAVGGSLSNKALDSLSSRAQQIVGKALGDPNAQKSDVPVATPNPVTSPGGLVSRAADVVTTPVGASVGGIALLAIGLYFVFKKG